MHLQAVVSAYYGDVESRAYPQAWALLSFSCTGGQALTEQGTSEIGRAHV